MAAASFSEGRGSLLASMALSTSARFTFSLEVYTSILSICEKLCWRDDMNFVLLSSSERTIAPSDLLATSSNKPPRPVTLINLLYSIAQFFKEGLQNKDMKLEIRNLKSKT